MFEYKIHTRRDKTFQGETIDVTAMPMQAMLSMAGAAGAIQTDAADLLTFVHALLGSTELLTEPSRALLSPAGPLPDRFHHGLTGFCSCETAAAGTVYDAGWGHSGDIPGYFSAIVDGVTFPHDALDESRRIELDIGELQRREPPPPRPHQPALSSEPHVRPGSQISRCRA